MIGALSVLDNLGNNSEVTAGNVLTKAEVRTIVNDIFTEFVNFITPINIYKVTSFDYDNQQAQGESKSLSVNAIVTGTKRKESAAGRETKGERKAFIKYRELGLDAEPNDSRVNCNGVEYRVTSMSNPADADAVIILDLVAL